MQAKATLVIYAIMTTSGISLKVCDKEDFFLHTQDTIKIEEFEYSKHIEEISEEEMLLKYISTLEERKQKILADSHVRIKLIEDRIKAVKLLTHQNSGSEVIDHAEVFDGPFDLF